jgi:hypothetical protein
MVEANFLLKPHNVLNFAFDELYVLVIGLFDQHLTESVS